MQHSCTLWGFFVLWWLAKKSLDCWWDRLLCFKPQLKIAPDSWNIVNNTTRKLACFKVNFFYLTFGPHFVLLAGCSQEAVKIKAWTYCICCLREQKFEVKAQMTGICRMLLKGKSFMLGSFHVNMPHPPWGTVSSIRLHITCLLTKKSGEPHIADKCVICKQWAVENYELGAVVFARKARLYETGFLLPGVSFYRMRSHIKVCIIHHFFFTFSYRWKQITGKLHPVWKMAGWHRSMGCPSANCLLLKERTGTDRLPLLQLLSTLISQRDCSQLQGRRTERQ